MSSDRSRTSATSTPARPGRGVPGFHPGDWSFAAPLPLLRGALGGDPGAPLTLSAELALDADDPHLRAHFPDFAIFPGVFLLEALRQAVAGTFLTLGTAPPDATVVRSLRFLAPLCAGDRAHLRATLQPLGGQVWFADAQVLRGDGLLAARLKVEFAATAGGPADPDVLAPYELLPHGHPMLLIDRVLALDPGRSITAIKAITCTEPCYRALASALPPASRAYPSALLLESFGQAGALLWFGSHVAPAGVIMLASARNCRIEGQAYPGDVLRHVVSLDKVVGDNVLVAGETWVGERRVAVVESMMAAVRPQAGLGARVAPPTNAPS